MTLTNVEKDDFVVRKMSLKVFRLVLPVVIIGCFAVYATVYIHALWSDIGGNVIIKHREDIYSVKPEIKRGIISYDESHPKFDSERRSADKKLYIHTSLDGSEVKEGGNTASLIVTTTATVQEKTIEITTLQEKQTEESTTTISEKETPQSTSTTEEVEKITTITTMQSSTSTTEAAEKEHATATRVTIMDRTTSSVDSASTEKMDVCDYTTCTNTAIRPYLANVSMVDVERRHLDVGNGGTWTPTSCESRYKVAIIIPYRDRFPHLVIFLNNMHTFLQGQNLQYQVFLIEQDSPEIFNRAALMNIGFLQASSAASFDCYIFHDVDLLPENTCNLYNCNKSPRHLAVAMNKFKYTLPYTNYVGGALAMTGEDMNTMNGFSNLMFGWGGEDDETYNRMVHHKLAFHRYSMKIGRYTMIYHKRDSGNPIGRRSFKAVYEYFPFHHLDGVNTTSYQLQSRVNHKLYTHVKVKIAGPLKASEIKPYMAAAMRNMTRNYNRLDLKDSINDYIRRFLLR